MQRIPWQQLSPAALRGIIMDVITREGTDVHDCDTFDPDASVEMVMGKLTSGDLVIVFDEEHNSCAIVSSDSLE